MRFQIVLLAILILALLAAGIHAAVISDSGGRPVAGEVLLLPTTEADRQSIAIVDFEHKTMSVLKVRPTDGSTQVMSVIPYLQRRTATRP